ncbi:hypothetical protein WN943_016461 [Citrus x changshan-huyou]
MYNILAGVGRYVDAERLRRVMDERNALKVPGRSLAYIGKAPEMLLLPKFFQLVISSLFLTSLKKVGHSCSLRKHQDQNLNLFLEAENVKKWRNLREIRQLPRSQ